LSINLTASFKLPLKTGDSIALNSDKKSAGNSLLHGGGLAPDRLDESKPSKAC
jgi:hypothetical protein